MRTGDVDSILKRDYRCRKGPGMDSARRGPTSVRVIVVDELTCRVNEHRLFSRRTPLATLLTFRSRNRLLSFCLAGLVWIGIPSFTRAETPNLLDESVRERLFEELVLQFEQVERTNLLKKVVRFATPSVVHIEATRSDVDSRGYARKPSEEAGSGVIISIDDRRYVLTNRHVIDDAPKTGIVVRFADGRTTNPVDVWSDRFTDVAVMAVEAQDLVPARLGDSDGLEIGDYVLAVGSPFGLSHSVTYGIISAKGRRDLKLGDGSIRYQDFLQTDAAINPGNSGGPLLNLRGEVIGINTAIASSSGGSEGIGFTIPVNMAHTVARQLVTYGRTRRAYLGVRLYRKEQYTTDVANRLGLTRPSGALVRSVTQGSPAEEAGFQPDDIVLRFDSRIIEDDDHLIKIVGFTQVGKAVAVDVLRSGKKISLELVLEERSRFEVD